MHFVSYAPNCMPLIQMSATYGDKEWPSVKIWASYIYISTRSLWVLKKKSECPYIYFFHPIQNYREYWLFRIYRITVCYTSLQPFSTSPSSLSHEGQFALLPSPYSFNAMRKFDLVAMNRSLLSVISNKNVWHLGYLSVNQQFSTLPRLVVVKIMCFDCSLG